MSDRIEALETARRFYGVHQTQDLRAGHHRLVDQCAKHLAPLYLLTDRAAIDVAMQAAGEAESDTVNTFVDVDRSSGTHVVLRDTGRNSVHMISAAELMHLVRARRAHDPPG